MEIMYRDDWGARAPTNRTERNLSGPSTAHWNGGGVKWQSIIGKDAQVNWMMRRMRAVQGFHMDGRGWSDIAYNFANDPWGNYLWEGRGLNVRSAAQGTAVGNDTSHAIYTATGLGDGPIMQASLDMIDEAATFIAANTQADDILVGHRDWKGTTCPGNFIYGELSQLNEDGDEEPGTLDPTPVEPIDTMGATISIFSLEGGYGVVDALGEVQTFGAQWLGDTQGINLNAPIVDAESTDSGRGYYLVAADGGLFAYGDAMFLGSMGGTALVAPIVAIEVEPTGYWMAAADGGIFTFGGLDFSGRPVVV